MPTLPPSKAGWKYEKGGQLVCSCFARAVTHHAVLTCHYICYRGCAGTMCYKHWRDKRLNPSGFRVVSREYPHEPVAIYKDLRCASPCSCHAGTLQKTVLLDFILHCCIATRQL